MMQHHMNEHHKLEHGERYDLGSRPRRETVQEKSLEELPSNANEVVFLVLVLILVLVWYDSVKGLMNVRCLSRLPPL